MKSQDGWRCSRCGQFIVALLSGGTGRAIVGGKTVCYPCVDTLHRERLKRAAKTTAYIASDAQTVTTWTGGHLGHVVRVRPVRGSERFIFGPQISIKVRDVHGREWVGRGVRGCFVNLRRVGK